MQSRLQGEAGTTVTVTWLDSAASSHTADLTHSGYTSTTVDYQMLGDVGYIKIRQFDGSTPSELDYAIRALDGGTLPPLPGWPRGLRALCAACPATWTAPRVPAV